MTWDDARLTEEGKRQARTANGAWAKQIKNKVPFPESFFVSPLNRCLETAYITFDGLDKDSVRPFRPVVKEVRSLFVSVSHLQASRLTVMKCS
jgi:broad specificity phosphatase PhoE